MRSANVCLANSASIKLPQANGLTSDELLEALQPVFQTSLEGRSEFGTNDLIGRPALVMGQLQADWPHPKLRTFFLLTLAAIKGGFNMRDPEQPESHQIEHAKDIFEQIIEYCEPTQTLAKNGNERYKRVDLVRFTYEYAPSQDIFLQYFFEYMGDSNFLDVLSHFANFADWDIKRKRELVPRMASFADFLMENFFLPRKMTSLGVKSDADHL